MSKEPDPQPQEVPATLEDFLWYVRHYEDAIFVREKVNETSFDVVALSSLPPQRWGYYVAKWLNEGHVPVRVIEEQ